MKIFIGNKAESPLYRPSSSRHQKLLAIAVLCACIPAQAQAGWVGDAAVSAGDWLTSWGRDLPAQKRVAVPKIRAAGATGNDCLKRHKDKADQNIKDRAALDAAMILPSTKGIGEMSCFDKYKNFSLSGMLGFPSLTSLLDQLKGQACSYADQQVGRATSPVNQSVWLPGGGRVNTSVVFGDAAKGKGPVSAGARPTGQYQLPQIFK